MIANDSDYDDEDDEENDNYGVYLLFQLNLTRLHSLLYIRFIIFKFREKFPNETTYWPEK